MSEQGRKEALDRWVRNREIGDLEEAMRHETDPKAKRALGSRIARLKDADRVERPA